MKAITIDEYGATPKLTDQPEPKAGVEEVLINIAAAGINPMDSMIASGMMKEFLPATFPLTLGADVAGVIEAVGDGTSRFSVGDAVFGQLMATSAGTYAEKVAVSESAAIAQVPGGLDAVSAAAIPTAGVTALQIVDSLGSLKGKNVLLVGAAGGVGSFAAQLAANAGAHVIAVAKSDDAERLRGYGVAHTIDYTTASVPDAVRKLHPGGVDILVDLASDADAFASYAVLVTSGGTALTTRGAANTDALAKSGVTGANFGVNVTSSDLETLAAQIVEGRITLPPVSRVALEDVVRSNDGHGSGKTVIVL